MDSTTENFHVLHDLSHDEEFQVFFVNSTKANTNNDQERLSVPPLLDIEANNLFIYVEHRLHKRVKLFLDSFYKKRLIEQQQFEQQKQQPNSLFMQICGNKIPQLRLQRLVAPSNQLCCSRGTRSISSRKRSSSCTTGGDDMFSFIPDNPDHVLCHSYLFRFKFDFDKEEDDWRIGICETLHTLSDIQSKTLADDKAFIVQLARKWSNSAYYKDTKPFTVSSPTNNVSDNSSNSNSNRSYGGTAKLPIERNSTNSLIRKIIDMNSSAILNETNNNSPIVKKEINSIIPAGRVSSLVKAINKIDAESKKHSISSTRQSIVERKSLADVLVLKQDQEKKCIEKVLEKEYEEGVEILEEINIEKRVNEKQIEPIEVIVDPLPMSSNIQEPIIIIKSSKTIDTVKAPIDTIITLPKENKKQMNIKNIVHLKKKCKEKCILNSYLWLILFSIQFIIIFTLAIVYLLKE